LIRDPEADFSYPEVRLMPEWAMFVFVAVAGWVTLSAFVGLSLGRWFRRLSGDPVAVRTLRSPDRGERWMTEPRSAGLGANTLYKPTL
jgi:hypothetical protein